MAVLAQQGIQTSIHYPPVHSFTYYRSLWAEGNNHRLPVTEQIASRLVTLPLYPSLTMAQLDTVVAAIYAYFR
jgi:dTDP-4-amino-4,6-dideoxygalactose transaminase